MSQDLETKIMKHNIAYLYIYVCHNTCKMFDTCANILHVKFKIMGSESSDPTI